MIKIENVVTPSSKQWRSLILGARNAMNSWEKSDSTFYPCYNTLISHKIGPNDMDLMTRLRNAGTDHRKFMRMITVYLDVTAPLYWWKEFDTYKIGSVANSCSTMHKIHAKQFTLEDFSCEHLLDYSADYQLYRFDDKHFSAMITDEDPTEMWSFEPLDILKVTIKGLNRYRDLYLKTNNRVYWWQMIQLLPSSYNQKRTVMLNYEVLANMYASRKNHKLDEWREFCEWVETLPYYELITGKERTLEYADQPGLADAAAPVFELGC